MKPFEGLRIIDLTRILSGPYCTMYFADLGAEVIKIEPPQGDDTRHWGPPFIDSESTYFLSINRNKRSVMLDLRTDTDRTRLCELIRHADIVVENFRPGTLERLGLGFKTLSELNPQIILASISGFGQTGPYAQEPGYDVIAQGMGGLMAVTGEVGGPPLKAGFSLADISAGMWAIIGILTALHRRTTYPEPQWIDISLLESMMAFQTYLATNYFATGQDPRAMGNAHPSICPYQTFPAQDGYFNLAVGNEKLWQKFCQVITHPEWQDDSRFRTNADRVEHRDELVNALELIFRDKSVKTWVDLFRESGIPAGPIYHLSDLYRDPHVTQRHDIFTVDHPVVGKLLQIAPPVRFLAGPDSSPNCNPPPLLGEHTQMILEQFGLKSSPSHDTTKLTFRTW
ncbi:CaiB/BaiF CoA transferase family protein [Sulfobacillus thermosulfidooxidans]|uniref:CaiB/BaiF CoA transferase family protein n=1 Tax=Sulfobacillus thermosulfidooxidans TaxID=28034 RepID=UPI00040880AB|nr:CoA transferase [Sulfobacillus thermosulfidooxidans]